jgi:Big-like domain-containing protein
MRRTLTLLAVFALASLSVATAATTLVTVRPPVADVVDWGQLGAPPTVVPYAFLANSGFADPLLGHFVAPGTTGEIVQQGSGWLGNFASGDNILWTNNNGPLTLVFDRGYATVGAQIQTDFFGAFTARITAYNGTKLLGSVTENGNSTSAGDNSAIFIGVSTGTVQLITKVVFSVTSCSNACANFAINQLSLTFQSTKTSLASSPNPSSVGAPVTFTATITASVGTVPNGETVTFTDTTTSSILGTGATSGGVATFTTSGLAIGSHAITASYAGDSGFSPSTSPKLTQKVQ